MVEMGDAKDLLAEAEGSDDALVKRLRGVLKERIDTVEGSQMSDKDAAELDAFRRGALFEQAGIGNAEPTEKLFREALSGRDDLTVEAIQAEAAKYGLTGEQSSPPPNPASEAEVTAHQAITDAAGEAPAAPPGIEERMKAAKSIEELRALEAEAGLTASGEEHLDIF